MDRLYAMGRKGQTTCAGFYRYASGNREPIYDEQVDAWISEEARNHSVRRRELISPDEIIDRCIVSLATEGARILEEGIALRSGDIDITWTAGCAFPRHLGGPMFWAEQEKLPDVALRISDYYQRYQTPHWRPCGLLSFAAQHGLSFDQALKQYQAP